MARQHPADVSKYRQLVLFQRIEQAPMRTASAHDRRSGRNRFVQLASGMDSHAKLFCNIILAELTDAAEQVFA